MPEHETPYFDVGGWSAATRHGMVWFLFQDKEKQMNPDLYNEAVDVMNEVIRTGNPPFGGWR